MAIFSSLAGGMRRSLLNLAKRLQKSSSIKDAGRSMSSQRTMVLQPSRFQWRKCKDLLHMYTLIGAVPLGLLILYSNLFIGPSELAEIPEGYDPQEYEYFNHPIKRWFAKIYVEDVQHYEKYLHYLCEQEEKRQMNLLENKIRRLMAERGDYKGWYYLPFTAKYVRFMREEEEQLETDFYGTNE